jgi:hypothetical protein
MLSSFSLSDRVLDQSETGRLTTFVPVRAIHLPKDDSLWLSRQGGSHKSTNLEPVNTEPAKQKRTDHQFKIIS